ncbi:zona pellucida sperm-binding protein 3-like isoform X1 [Grus americana]|uniref:zona pellucida sperm-binding protein 3-like isoform X1 n=1 Tax=Grus americana TaxID=9117 RepID=UPI0024078E8D|nr:zona pellucida sperm-binding protein 3-like isoform X1 [Grus americana]
MGPKNGLILTLLCWAAGEVAAYPPWDFSWGAQADPHAWSWVEDPHSRAISSQQPVMVQCQEAQLVVTAHRDLFGTGRLINAADLTLGPAACKYSSLNPAHNTVTFIAGLHECGSVVQVRWSPFQSSPCHPTTTEQLQAAPLRTGHSLRCRGGGGLWVLDPEEHLRGRTSGYFPQSKAFFPKTALPFPSDTCQRCRPPPPSDPFHSYFGPFNSWRREWGFFSIPFSPTFPPPFFGFPQRFPVGKGWICGLVVVGGGVSSLPASQHFSPQITPDSLIYRTLLNYDPSPASNPVIIRSNPAVIPIECHYPRRENVSSNAIRPTWAPFSSTLSAEERLVFSLRLMNEDWSAERPFTGFQLGDVLNIQAEVGTESHVPLRLFVDSCVAALSPGTDSSPHYTIIDFNGCLVDGRSDDTSSAFITPRPQEDVLRFSIDVFRFAGDTRNLIYITCHLKVTPADQAPDPLNKACSFNKARNTWSPVEGTRDICSCCEMGNCESPALSRRLNPLEQWPGRRFRRHDANGKEAEADVVIGPVLLSRDPGAVGERQEGGQGGVTAVPAMGTGLICVAASMGLAGVALAIGVGRRRCAHASA